MASTLVRPVNGRMVGGVCAGLARRFGVSANTMRVIFVVSCIVIPGSQILIYPILWALIPSER
ncbi:PspC domain-containing protein [Kribbella sp. NPDC051718]|uniref:PspC domain-containing protein n=1 Tax=Kribbella sp. NPDC051718 TaxID=3155168 RepID=UPI00343B45F8